MSEGMLQGKGSISLNESPCCQVELEFQDAKFVDDETEVKFFTCSKCGKKFTETWKPIEWEEELN